MAAVYMAIYGENKNAVNRMLDKALKKQAIQNSGIYGSGIYDILGFA
jgi:hypothetical protein